MRVRAPYELRGRDDRSTRNTVSRQLKEHGIAFQSEPASYALAPDWPMPLPRLCVKGRGEGRIHPAGKAEIARVLRFFGPSCVYGLRSIELAYCPRTDHDKGLLMGRIIVPGRIVLYDQPPSPWLLSYQLSAGAATRLQCAGAIVERDGPGGPTAVRWPGTTLRDYMIFDVLMHEVGHHMAQQYTGKRRVRVRRTKDHEAFADLFARRCRLLYHGGDSDGNSGPNGDGTAW